MSVELVKKEKVLSVGATVLGLALISLCKLGTIFQSLHSIM